MDIRKARTRTLIQLGGLIEKSGLLQELGLKTGDDLQRDPECHESAAVLMGGFIELHKALSEVDGQAQKLLWAERGKKGLGE